MDLIQIADEKLAEIKARKAELIEEERTLRAQRDLLAGATKAPAITTPVRDETPAERDAMNAKIAETVKCGRKPKAERGGKTIGEKVIDHLAKCPNFGATVDVIAFHIEEERRSVSYTLQNLKKAGKVERIGNGWALAGGPSMILMTADEDSDHEDAAELDKPPIGRDYGVDIGQDAAE